MPLPSLPLVLTHAEVSPQDTKGVTVPYDDSPLRTSKCAGEKSRARASIFYGQFCVMCFGEMSPLA